MRELVRDYIKKFRLLTTDRPLLVGVSGGADSIALLTVLVRLGYSCIGAHCNFHLRGEESVRDELFVSDYVSSLRIPFCKIDFDTRQYAAVHRLSIEMAARKLRYEWFEKKRQEYEAQAIAVAHHRDDNIETVLMNLIRGTGIRGLAGIRPKNGFIVRPLLSISREEIVAWLSKEKLPYVTDSTNLSEAYTRNFVRLRVLPLLEEINPSVRNAIERTSVNLSDVETIYLDVIEKAKTVVFQEKDRISIPLLMQYPAPATILYELLRPYNFTRLVINDIFLALNKESGKIFYSSTYRLIKDRDSLLITPLTQPDCDSNYVLAGETGKLEYPIKLSWEKVVLDKDFHIRKDKNIAYFDCEKLTFPLKLRHWKEGDWFIPFGRKGRKKLSDYFSDHKFSYRDKEQIWLLCSGENIIWVTGERSDNRFCVEKATREVLVVHFFQQKYCNK